MFIATAFAYPIALALLCLGAGLLLDRVSGGFLPTALLPALGAAALIATSQLSTYVWPIAQATPYLLAAIAAAGFLLGRTRVRAIVARGQANGWLIVLPVLVYAIALAPVLLAARPTFSSYLVLTDSAVHLLGANYLIEHGQHYANLDLRNSYGEFINNFYNTSYPSGADTLFGGSARLLRLPLIWAYQPFNAFMLATATGPVWLLVRRLGLRGGWAALATVTTTVPALVYGYELIGSIKEITALPMMLTLGALAVAHREWLRRAPAGTIPFALAAAAGVSALGVGFGAWAFATTALLLLVLARELIARRERLSHAMLLLITGAVVALLSAIPTWRNIAGSLQIAKTIAATSNPGNLTKSLNPLQVLGTWLSASYRFSPTGTALQLTDLLAAIALLACVVGAIHIIRARHFALGGWIAAMLGVWLAATAYSTTWVDAKALMLSSPLVVLLAWGGVAALRASSSRLVIQMAAGLLALALAGGALASNAVQYHSSDLAPTGRYEELASLNSRFAGRGPTLFMDFDEYAMYQLRDLDLGGVDFIYPPLSLTGYVMKHGGVVDLDGISPAVLEAYPLIITRRDPEASRPPSAYDLAWQGAYYQVWVRRPRAPVAIEHAGLGGLTPVQCPLIGRLARRAQADGAQLVSASPPELVRIGLVQAHHPASWRRAVIGLRITGPGRLHSAFGIPHSGVWYVWLQGDLMRPLSVRIDGHEVGSVGEQLGGDALNPNTMAPLPVHLSAGRHVLELTRGGFTLAPGDGGLSQLDRVFFTPAGASDETLRTTPPAAWHSLCGHAYDWIEVVRG